MDFIVSDKCERTTRNCNAEDSCRRCYYLNNKQLWAKAYADNRKQRLEQRREHLYGITPEEYDAALLLGCAACTRPFGSTVFTRPNIDHNQHCCKTIGKIRSMRICGKCRRGVICGRCNVVLGMLEEEARLLPQYLIEYLSKYRNDREQVRPRHLRKFRK